MAGVQVVSLALEHKAPVSESCPLYNEASAIIGYVVLSSKLIIQ